MAEQGTTPEVVTTDLQSLAREGEDRAALLWSKLYNATTGELHNSLVCHEWLCGTLRDLHRNPAEHTPDEWEEKIGLLLCEAEGLLTGRSN